MLVFSVKKLVRCLFSHSKQSFWVSLAKLPQLNNSHETLLLKFSEIDQVYH